MRVLIFFLILLGIAFTLHTLQVPQVPKVPHILPTPPTPQVPQTWQTFAESNKCLTSPDNYTQLYSDLGAFNQSYTWSDVRKWGGTLRNHDYIKRHWPDIAHLIDKNILWAENMYDEPISLPADDCCKPYRDAQDMYNRSKCLRNAYSRDSHAFFNCPASFVSVPQKFPIFSQTKLHCFSDILIPSNYHFKGERLSDLIPWSVKKPILFWRGSTTGGMAKSRQDLQYFARFNVVKWAANVTDADVKFSGVVQGNHVSQLGSRVSMTNQLKYKYILVIEGNTFVSRLVSQLGTNSLVLLYRPMFLEWHTERIKAWEHYVPATELSDAFTWVKKNDRLAELITVRANELVKKHLRVEDIKCYLALALIEYSKLFRDKN